MKISSTGIKWAVAALVVLAIALAAGRALKARQARQVAPTTTAQASPTGVELASSDVVTVQPRELLQGLPVSGTLRAVNSAVVKSRVAGELQNLTVREGDSVKAGQVLARIDPTEFQARWQQARQQADAAQAQVDLAQRAYDNNRALVDQGFISRTALDTSLINLQAAQATHRAAVAAADVARKALDDTTLKAPLSGQVAQRLAQPGERLPIDARIVEIVDLSQLELEASVPAADSLTLKPGQSAELRVEGSQQAVAAKLVRINPSAQAASRSVTVYLSLTNPGGAQPLRQGLFAQGTLGGKRSTVLAVPLDAVRTDKVQPYVQLIADGKVQHQSVSLGERGLVGDQQMVAITGLAEGAQVVRGSAGSLREGSAVRFTAAGGAAASSAASPAKTSP